MTMNEMEEPRTNLCCLELGDLVLVAVNLAIHALLQVLRGVRLQYVLCQLILHDLQLFLQVADVNTTSGHSVQHYTNMSTTQDKTL